MPSHREKLAWLLILTAVFLTSQAAFADWNSAPENVVPGHPTWIFTPNSTLPNGKHGLIVVLHGCNQTNDQLNRHSPDSYRVVRHLPRFRVLGNPAPLARAVDGDGTSRRHAER